MNYLKRLDKKSLKIVKAIGALADSDGVFAYIVGGVVRDLILDKPILDLDIVFEFPSYDFILKMVKHLSVPATLYPQFKTASIQIGQLRVDLALARKESYSQPGALPTVAVSTIKDDLFRRDFTINAMMISINKKTWGDCIDLFGGLLDLKQKRIKILHVKSFVDDPTRILRAIRFEQRLGYRLEINTLNLLKDALAKNCVDSVKPPRYFAEFKKILKEPFPSKSIQRLNAFKGGLEFLAKPMKIDVFLIKLIEQRMKRFPLVLVEDNAWLVVLIALFNELNEKQVDEMLKKFHFKKEEKESIITARLSGELLKELDRQRIKHSDVFQTLKQLPEPVVLYLWAKTSSVRIQNRLKRFLNVDRKVVLNIQGEDLKKMGCESGVRMGDILKKILLEKINGKIKTRQDELVMASKLIQHRMLYVSDIQHSDS